MKNASDVAKEFRRSVLPARLREAISYAIDTDIPLCSQGENKKPILVNHNLKWVSKFRDMYLEAIYNHYFMEDYPLETKQKAIKLFDTEFSRMMELIIWTLRALGYDVEYTPTEQLSSPISSAISVLGLTALDCKVSDPYILGSILER